MSENESLEACLELLLSNKGISYWGSMGNSTKYLRLEITLMCDSLEGDAGACEWEWGLLRGPKSLQTYEKPIALGAPQPSVRVS